LSVRLPSWKRNYFEVCEGEAFLFYIAFGDVTQKLPLDGKKYRCAGVPSGFDLMAYDKAHHADVFDGFLHDYPWDRLKEENPGLACKIAHSRGCAVLRGNRKNPQTLNYLRDCVGVLTCLLDHGACAVSDPQMFQWWSPDLWRERIFDPAAPVPLHHVVTLYSEDEASPNLLWVHTRGMRKFGRPDISVRGVGAAYKDAVVNLCQRFIEHQAFGAVIPEGKPVRMASLPPGGVARHGGSLDDPDFNNVHVEIVWPKRALSTRRV
jgi:hypothetical protein